jgi:hypothetical protein
MPVRFSFSPARPATILVFLILFGGLLLTGPARADHSFSRESVVVVRGCETEPPVLDVSRGYPIILVTMSCGVGTPPEAIMFIRTKDARAASLGPISEHLGGNDERWVANKVDVDFGPGGSFTFFGLGRCSGSGSPGDCVSANFAQIQDGRTNVTAFEQPLNNLGLPLGSSTAWYFSPNGPGGWAPTLLGSGAYGLPWVGWEEGSLYAQTAIDTSPISLTSKDGLAWPFAGDPPFSVGNYNLDIPDVVVLDTGNVHGFLLDDPTTPTQVTAPLPNDIGITDTATISATRGGPTPGATIQQDGQVITSDDLEGGNFFYCPCPKGGTGVVVRHIHLSSKTGDRSYEVGNISGSSPWIDIYKHDENGNRLRARIIVEGDGWFGSWGNKFLTGAAVDDNGVIHLCMEESTGTEDEVSWVEVEVDESKLTWKPA